jgi:hypothetical protein
MLVCKQPSGEIFASSLLSNLITPQAVSPTALRPHLAAKEIIVTNPASLHRGVIEELEH